jgi:YVTN family beta-propeller protein
MSARSLAPAVAALLLACSCASGTLVVLNKSDDTVWLIDARRGTTRAVVPTGTQPHEVVVTRDGRFAVVSNYGSGNAPGHTLSVIDLSGSRPPRTLELGAFQLPHGLCLVPDSDRLLVTCEGSRAVVEVDVARAVVLRALPTEATTSHMVAALPDGSRAFVANIGSASVSVLDLASGALIATIPTGAGCEGIDVTPDGSEVWATNRAANSVSVIDARTLVVRETLSTPGFPLRVKITPDGRLALVSCAAAGQVAVFEVATRKLRKAVDIAWRVEAKSGNAFLDAFGGSAVPIGIQIHPSGERAWVATSGADRVAVIDLESLEIVEVLKTGHEPDGLGFSPRAARATASITPGAAPRP